MSAERKRGPAPGTGLQQKSYVNAKAAWGPDMPDWVKVLAQQCDASSQNKVAAVLGYGGGVINQVIHRKYAAPHQVENVVRAHFMGDTVKCPVEQVITLKRCLNHQERSKHFMPSNELNIQLYHACKTCPHHARNLRPEGGDNAQP